MAPKKKKNKLLVKLISGAGTGFFYLFKKTPAIAQKKLALRKFDPIVNQYVIFNEAKLKFSTSPHQGGDVPDLPKIKAPLFPYSIPLSTFAKPVAWLAASGAAYWLAKPMLDRIQHLNKHGYKPHHSQFPTVVVCKDRKDPDHRVIMFRRPLTREQAEQLRQRRRDKKFAMEVKRAIAYRKFAKHKALAALKRRGRTLPYVLRNRRALANLRTAVAMRAMGIKAPRHQRMHALKFRRYLPLVRKYRQLKQKRKSILRKRQIHKMKKLGAFYSKLNVDEKVKFKKQYQKLMRYKLLQRHHLLKKVQKLKKFKLRHKLNQMQKIKKIKKLQHMKKLQQRKQRLLQRKQLIQQRKQLIQQRKQRIQQLRAKAAQQHSV